MPIEDYLYPVGVCSCSCRMPPASSQWGSTDLKPYEICGQAYRRVYGSPDEVWDVTRVGSTLFSFARVMEPSEPEQLKEVVTQRSKQSPEQRPEFQLKPAMAPSALREECTMSSCASISLDRWLPRSCTHRFLQPSWHRSPDFPRNSSLRHIDRGPDRSARGPCRGALWSPTRGWDGYQLSARLVRKSRSRIRRRRTWCS